jgi:hypothetical protein
MINNNGIEVGSTDAELQIDTVRLNVVGVSPVNGFANFYYNWDPAQGELYIASYRNLGDPCNTGTMTIARVTFQALATGNASANFVFNYSKIVACDINATNILGSVGNGVYTIY